MPRLWFVVSLAAVLVSCGVDPLSGRVILSGSATLAPVVERQISGWSGQHPRVEVRIEAIGSDAGLERLLQYEEADLALLSRPLSDEERSRVSAKGGSLLVLPVAWDAVSLVVPATNTWAQSLTREQAARAFTSATLWSDLDPTWPTLPLHRFVLGPRSGTGDVLASALLGGAKRLLYGSGSMQSSEDDRILARGIADVPGSVGFLGWATARESGAGLRVLALDHVEPTTATIHDRTYPLVRELTLVTTRDRWSSRPELRSLVRHLYQKYPAVLEGTSLVPLDHDALESVDAILKE